MLSLRLPDELETRLTVASRLSGRSKAAIARNALIEYLEELEDYRDAIEVLSRHEPTITLAELERELDLAH